MDEAGKRKKMLKKKDTTVEVIKKMWLQISISVIIAIILGIGSLIITLRDNYKFVIPHEFSKIKGTLDSIKTGISDSDEKNIKFYKEIGESVDSNTVNINRNTVELKKVINLLRKGEDRDKIIFSTVKSLKDKYSDEFNSTSNNTKVNDLRNNNDGTIEPIKSTDNINVVNNTATIIDSSNYNYLPDMKIFFSYASPSFVW